MSESLDHDAVVAALQAGLGGAWTVTVRAARPDAPLIAMFSGVLQRAEAKDADDPAGSDFVWYVGTEETTFGAFAIPTAGFGHARWEATPRGPALMVRSADVLLALFPRAAE